MAVSIWLVLLSLPIVSRMTVKYSYQNYNKLKNQPKKGFYFSSSKYLTVKKQQQKSSEFVSDLIVSFIIFNKYIKDITIVIFSIRIVI